MYEKKMLIYKIDNVKIIDVEFLSAEGDYFVKEGYYHDNPIDYFLEEMNN